MSIIQQQATVAPPQTRSRPVWVDWALSIGIFVVLPPLLILMGLLEAFLMRGYEE